MEDNFTKSNSPHMSEDVRELMKAFLKARVTFTKTGKSGRNINQKYDYSKIEDIYDAVIPGLAVNDIAATHFAYPYDRDLMLLETRLTHSISGQWMSDKRFLMCEKPGNQAIGIANTYMRKYAVLSLCGIATEDDDAAEEEEYIKEKTTNNNTQRIEQKEEPYNVDELLGQSEFAALEQAINLCVNKEWLEERLCEFNKTTHVRYIRLDKFDGALNFIKKYGKTKQG